jgi:flavodoxin
MPISEGVPSISAAVVFSSRFGSTERVAKSLESGLRQGGMRTLRANITEIAPESLKQYDLICLGGPTEAFGASKPMKEFLQAIKGIDLQGKLCFAFDTKLDSRLSGSAAKRIEQALDDQGLRVIYPRESAIVKTVKQGGAITGAVLGEGEEKKFEQVGLKVAASAAESMAIIQT